MLARVITLLLEETKKCAEWRKSGERVTDGERRKVRRDNRREGKERNGTRVEDMERDTQELCELQQ